MTPAIWSLLLPCGGPTMWQKLERLIIYLD